MSFNEKKSYELLDDIFLEKLKSVSYMDLDQKIREYNAKFYPEPEYLGVRDLIEYWSELGLKLNHRQIKRWNHIVRNKTDIFIRNTNKKYDPSNKDHIGKSTAEYPVYAVEDFEPLLEKQKMLHDARSKIKKGEIPAGKTRYSILRDYRKLEPSIEELSLLSDSYSTFIGWLAKEKIKEEVNDMDIDPKIKNEFLKIIKSIQPDTKKID